MVKLGIDPYQIMNTWIKRKAKKFKFIIHVIWRRCFFTHINFIISFVDDGTQYYIGTQGMRKMFSFFMTPKIFT